MNYQSIYDRLIEHNRNTSKIKKQTESHHIIPKSFAKLDGIEDIHGSWNRVNLPIREHFIAHLLLARIWRGHKVKGPKMAKAIRNMTNNGKYTSKDYSWLKLNYSHSDEHKQKISDAKMGHIQSESTKQKISKTRLSKFADGYTYSEDYIKQQSDSHKGNKNSFFGKQHSDESKNKIKEARAKQIISEETKNKMSATHKRLARERKELIIILAMHLHYQ